jgi:hypothetical protein
MPDGVKLFGWHILPLDVYAAHRQELRGRSATQESIDSGEFAKRHLEILKEDPDARVIIYCMSPLLHFEVITNAL